MAKHKASITYKSSFLHSEYKKLSYHKQISYQRQRLSATQLYDKMHLKSLQQVTQGHLKWHYLTGRISLSIIQICRNSVSASCSLQNTTRVCGCLRPYTVIQANSDKSSIITMSPSSNVSQFLDGWYAMHRYGLLLQMSHGLSFCLCVWAYRWAVQKRLNRSRCRLEGWLKWVQGITY